MDRRGSLAEVRCAEGRARASGRADAYPSPPGVHGNPRARGSADRLRDRSIGFHARPSLSAREARTRSGAGLLAPGDESECRETGGGSTLPLGSNAHAPRRRSFPPGRERAAIGFHESVRGDCFRRRRAVVRLHAKACVSDFAGRGTPTPRVARDSSTVRGRWFARDPFDGANRSAQRLAAGVPSNHPRDRSRRRGRSWGRGACRGRGRDLRPLGRTAKPRCFPGRECASVDPCAGRKDRALPGSRDRRLEGLSVGTVRRLRIEIRLVRTLQAHRLLPSRPRAVEPVPEGRDQRGGVRRSGPPVVARLRGGRRRRVELGGWTRRALAAVRARPGVRTPDPIRIRSALCEQRGAAERVGSALPSEDERCAENAGADKSVYLAIGSTLDGRKRVLGMWIQRTEGAKFWLAILNELKQRGVVDILVLCADGLTGLPDAVEAAFPQTIFQTCIVHVIRSSVRFV
ncbi:MAG: hypothetical protein D6731_20880, partial [Planctomycetota bacterium]